MAKTKEELNELKKEYEILNNKLKELTEDELEIVVGGIVKLIRSCPDIKLNEGSASTMLKSTYSVLQELSDE